MAGPSVAAQRRQEALKLLGEGYGTSELVAKLAEQWGCSRRSARRYVAAAHQEMVDELEHVTRTEMLASLINRLETTARRAQEDGQHAAVVGACKVLAALCVYGSPPTERLPSWKRWL